MIRIRPRGGLHAALAIAATVLFPLAYGQELGRVPIEGTTSAGDKVLLHPDGRWQYVDVKKAEHAKSLADPYPENAVPPQAAQGGVFGIGRRVMPGDRDYNRGSLNPKLK